MGKHLDPAIVRHLAESKKRAALRDAGYFVTAGMHVAESGCDGGLSPDDCAALRHVLIQAHNCLFALAGGEDADEAAP